MNTATTAPLVVMTSMQLKKLVKDAVQKAFDELNIDSAKTEQEYLNQKQAAKYVNVSVNTLKFWQEAGLVKIYAMPGSNGTNIKRYKKTQLNEAVKSSEIQRYKYKTA